MSKEREPASRGVGGARRASEGAGRNTQPGCCDGREMLRPPAILLAGGLSMTSRGQVEGLAKSGRMVAVAGRGKARLLALFVGTGPPQADATEDARGPAKGGCVCH